ncbi:MAG: hypothetical protein C4305_06985 [Thermoleophilia bacterium]
MKEGAFNPRAQAARERRIPLWRWALWYLALAGGMLVFYVLLTPVWLGLRAAAWAAELQARARRRTER